MAERARSVKRMLDFAVMKVSPENTPSKFKSDNRKPSSLGASTKLKLPPQSTPSRQSKSNTDGKQNTRISPFVGIFETSKSFNRIPEEPNRSNQEPTQERYWTPCQSPDSVYKLVEPEGFEATIKKAAEVVAKKENISVPLNSSSGFAPTASEGGAHKMRLPGFPAAGSLCNALFVPCVGDRLDKKMEAGFSPKLDALLLTSLREAAYKHSWADLLVLASGDVTNTEVVLEFKSALDRFIHESLMPPYPRSPEIELVKAAV